MLYHGSKEMKIDEAYFVTVQSLVKFQAYCTKFYCADHGNRESDLIFCGPMYNKHFVLVDKVLFSHPEKSSECLNFLTNQN